MINGYMRLRMAPWILLANTGFTVGQLDHARATNLSPEQSQTSTAGRLSSLDFPKLDESPDRHEQPQNDTNSYLLYLRNLQNKQTPQSPMEKFGGGYQDYLQSPLQPLTVNLESVTYEVFEKDPVKYDQYEKAIARALHDWAEQGKAASSPDGRIVVAVVGAGRGPLVTRALKASDDVGVDIDIWALEKNQNAFVLLQRHNADGEKWAGRTHLVQGDMRTWKGPYRQRRANHCDVADRMLRPETPTIANQALQGEASAELDREYYPIDIVVSELLGSFADNELSPECLDGVQHLLNPVDGISIPASYTAHLTPIASPKLHADISSQANANRNAFETPYVVMLHAFDYLSTRSTYSHNHKNTSQSQDGQNRLECPSMSSSSPIIQQAWGFSHPNHHPYIQQPFPQSSSIERSGENDVTNTSNITNTHNTRHTALTFPIPNRGVCHGLAGYFEAVLYGSVELSTNPINMDQKSEGMISWFPIFFPLKVCQALLQVVICTSSTAFPPGSSDTLPLCFVSRTST